MLDHFKGILVLIVTVINFHMPLNYFNIILEHSTNGNLITVDEYKEFFTRSVLSKIHIFRSQELPM